MKQIDEEYEELKELVDTIEITSKLMGYQIQKNKNVISLYNQEARPHTEIKLIKWKDHSNTLSTISQGKLQILDEREQHKEKLNHLNKILQNL